MAVELIGTPIGWVSLAWTQNPGNMVGSNAIIVTDSAAGGMGVYKLNNKAVGAVNLQSADNPGFKISNVRPAAA
jgi:hypothetical protein